MESHNSAEIDELIAIQLIAYDDAARLQRAVFWLSILIAFVGVSLIFTDGDNVAFALGAFALCIAILSAFLTNKLGNLRAFAERVRKATLLTKGLGSNLSGFERRKIRSDFPGSEKAVESRVDKGYYASEAQPGPKRLAEMLEESAFWSKHLLKKSAGKSWLNFVLMSIVTVGIVLGYLQFGREQDASSNLKVIQVIMAGLTLLISRDLIGQALAYSGSERAVTDILARLQVLKARDESEILEDLFLVLGDYNSAVESAPLFLPGLYRKYESELDELWKKYL